MAHTALHFAAGLAIGMAIQSPVVREAWNRGRGLAPAVMRGLVVSWGLGLWAVVPSLMNYLGVPHAICTGWWMNLFLFHPLINRWGPHATILGAAALTAGFIAQYAMILAALLRIRSACRDIRRN